MPTAQGQSLGKILTSAAINSRTQLGAISGNNALLNHKPLEEAIMNSEQRRIVNRLRRAKPSDLRGKLFDDTRRMRYRTACSSKEGDTISQTCSAIYAAGVGMLSEGKFLEAREVFEHLLDGYFGGVVFALQEKAPPAPAGLFPGKKELDGMMRDVAVISRAWVVSDACEYARIEEGMMKAFAGRRMFGHSTIWPYYAVMALGKFGWVEDLLPIRTIEVSCHESTMEAHCSGSRNLIISRIPLVAHSHEKKLEAVEGVDWRIMEPVLRVLLLVMGASTVLMSLPNFAPLYGRSQNPVEFDRETERTRSLLAARLDQRLDFQPGRYSDETRQIHEAYKVLKALGIVEDCERGYAALTPKGKELVRGILETAMRTRVSFDPESYPPYSVTFVEKNVAPGRRLEPGQRNLLENQALE